MSGEVTREGLIRAIAHHEDCSEEVAEAIFEDAMRAEAANEMGFDRWTRLELWLGRAVFLGARVILAAALAGFIIYWIVAGFDAAWDFAAGL